MKMKFTGTCTNSQGTGYYRGENGKYYYGNPQNGYLRKTRQQQKEDDAKAAGRAQADAEQRRSIESARDAIAKSAPVKEGGLFCFLEYLAGFVVLGSVVTSFTIGILFVALFATAIALIIFSWPTYIGFLIDALKGGNLFLGIPMILFAVFYCGYFLRCVRTVWIKKQLKARKFFLICTLVVAIPVGILFFLTGEFHIISSLIEAVFAGLSLSSLPGFLLCFIEHLATKELRGDDRSFLKRVSIPVSNIFIGHSIGMIIFGIFALLVSLTLLSCLKFGYNLMTIGFISTVVLTGILFIAMGILSKKA